MQIKTYLFTLPGQWLNAHQQTMRVALYLLPVLALLGLAIWRPVTLSAQTTCQTQHTVVAGESLSKIGQRYSVSWRSIAQANNIINANLIYVGQRLCIPAVGAPPPPTTCQAQHVVGAGESLSKIGQRYGVSWQSIARANNIINANIIYVGQRLCIPSTSAPPPTTPPPGGNVPLISIVSVVPNQSVTIKTSNFPANQNFDVLMGAYGTKGVNGTYVIRTNSGQGGSFTITYTIPAEWRGAERMAIRLQSPSGYYSYNWFWNK